MITVHSFYKYQETCFYLKDIKKESSTLTYVVQKCNENEQKNQDIISNWRNNQYITKDDSQLYIREQYFFTQDLCSQCHKCIYFTGINKSSYSDNILIEKTNKSDIVIGFCDLRNNAFQAGCDRLYINCKFLNEKREYFEKISDIEFDFSIDLIVSLIESIERSAVKFRKPYKTINNACFALEPIEIMALKTISSRHRLFFANRDAISWVYGEIKEESNKKDIFVLESDEFNIHRYYQLFDNDIERVIWLDDASLAIIWNDNSYTVTGEIQQINRYINLI